VTRAYDSAFDDDPRDLVVDTAARRLLLGIERDEG